MKSIPSKIFLLCKTGSYLVGSQAKALANKQNIIEEKDWDLIVDPKNWYVVSLLIPKDAKLNNHGGLRFNIGGYQIDIWPCSIEQHLRQCVSLNKPEFVVDIMNGLVFSSIRT